MQTNDPVNAGRTYLDEHGRYREGQGRPEPPMGASEIATLLGFLERQRATFAWKIGGLDAPGLQATLGSSSMTLGGMLKHLTRIEDDMSTEWLLGRDQLPPWNAIDWDADHDWDWRSAADDTPERLRAGWTDAVARCRALMAEAAADPMSTAAPRLRYILPNMIEEYARHNGHADLLRESVDGLIGHDPPE
jgi:Protein of unknown function (DUF664)